MTKAVVQRSTGVTLMHAEHDLLQVWYGSQSAETLRARRADLEQFRQWAGVESDDAAITALCELPHGDANAIALQYRIAMREAQLAPATVNRRLGSLRSVVALARTLGHITWTLEVRGVESTNYRDTRGPGVAAYRAMVEQLQAGTVGKARRDLAIVRMLFDMALRRAEVVSLDLEHVDREAGRLSVMGKRRTERELLTIPNSTREALEGWLVSRGDAPGPLFVNFDRARKGGRLTGRSVARVVNAAGAAAGVTARVRPHGLPHSAITHALDAGKDVRDVAQFSRHRNLQTLVLSDDARRDIAGEVASLVASVA